MPDFSCASCPGVAVVARQNNAGRTNSYLVTNTLEKVLNIKVTVNALPPVTTAVLPGQTATVATGSTSASDAISMTCWA